MKDPIERQDVIDAIVTWTVEDRPDAEMPTDLVGRINALPSAQSDLITWLLDKIWDEEMWELNWQAFPELLCRKLEKLGYVKRKGDEYERLDQQTVSHSQDTRTRSNGGVGNGQSI